MDSQNSYRDQLSTLEEDGRRKWIYPKMPKGKLYNYRKYVSYVLLFILFFSPFIHWGGEQLVLFNLIERKFVFFGIVFMPQDFYIFFLLMILFLVGIILFTVVFGRVFCGWVCPQTIFMEMLFRRIEYFIEGDSAAQRRLNKMPWRKEKVIKKGMKHIIFFGLSFLIANVFLAYIISSKRLIEIITDPISQHWSGLLSITLFTFIFYYVFAFFREQVCTNVCPYGRLQSVLLDDDSIVIAYDFERGEPRGKMKKVENDLGDCIDCKACVHVCPTGIDIRHGTQLECVNCTACIDACDEIMEKVDRPRGLIRYASFSGIKDKHGFVWTKKAVSYIGVLFMLTALVGFSLTTRSSVDVTFLRTPGTLFYKVGEDSISNLYSIHIFNKDDEAVALEIELDNISGEVKFVGESPSEIAGQETYNGAAFVVLAKSDLKKGSQKIKLHIIDTKNNEMIEDIDTKFINP